jgi:anthranilate phosphoribosyltransferase
VRRGLGVRTFFNILGPMCNPAGVRRQLVGAFRAETAQTMASILAHLDAEHVVAVHADDGMDEVSLSGDTSLFEYRRADAGAGPQAPRAARIRPEDFGLGRVPLEALRGGTADDNAGLLRRILAGEEGPYQDVLVLNAAVALHASGAFADLPTCFEAARESLRSGAARARLDRLVAASREAPGIET